jgi:hypothetical protein
MSHDLTRKESREISVKLDSLTAEAITAFEKALGGRKALTEVLLLADGSSPETDLLLSLLADTGFEKVPLTRICRDAGLSLRDLIKTFDAAVLVRAHLRAKIAIADRLVPVVEDVMRRAAPHEDPCGACHGVGTIGPPQAADAPPMLCHQCRGRGTIPQTPDLDRQKLALEIGQLTQKSAGISLTQQTLVQPQAPLAYAPGAFDAFQQAIAEVMNTRPAPVVDADPVDG